MPRNPGLCSIGRAWNNMCTEGPGPSRIEHSHQTQGPVPCRSLHLVFRFARQPAASAPRSRDRPEGQPEDTLRTPATRHTFPAPPPPHRIQVRRTQVPQKRNRRGAIGPRRSPPEPDQKDPFMIRGFSPTADDMLLLQHPTQRPVTPPESGSKHGSPRQTAVDLRTPCEPESHHQSRTRNSRPARFENQHPVDKACSPVRSVGSQVIQRGRSCGRGACTQN